MGLEDSDILKDDDGKSSSSVTCSICLSDVNDFRERSFAMLQCGHQFHLDCIGSAFNMKGAMQCPNCRKIEKGQWLNGNGECSSTLHHDLPGNDDIFIDYATVLAATAHPSPYVGYVPVHPASLNSRNVPESSNSNNRHWHGPSIPAFYIPSEPIMRPLTCLFHSSGTRTGSSGAISMIPPYPGGSAQASDRVQALPQTYYQPGSSPAIRMPMIPGLRSPAPASWGSTHQPAGGSDTATRHGGSNTGTRQPRYLQRHGSIRSPPSQDRS